MASELLDTSAAGLLRVAEENVAAKRAIEVERIQVTLAWADRHGDDPQARPGAVPASKGGNRLIQLGGDGTPEVAELCFGELAIAFKFGVLSARNLAADALDLRHRLPLLYDALLAGRCEVWLARRIAVLSRPLPVERVGIVDAAVTAALDESPGRVVAVAEAKVIAADPEAHRERIAADDAKTGVWVSRRRAGDAVGDSDAGVAGEPSTLRVGAKISAGAALDFDATVEELADILERETAAGMDEGENAPTRGQLRAQAFELLADPYAAVRLLDGITDADSELGHASTPERPRRRRSAVINIHLSAWALKELAGDGVARVEEIGPMLISQLQDLLQRRDIIVRPVIDLNAVQAVSAYEHPTGMAERIRLRHLGDGFPHATSASGVRTDIDHATAYGTGSGQGGNTSDRNATPLTRRSHRIKTHQGYQVKQLGLGAHRWITPNGLARVVTPHGTAKVELLHARDGTTTDARANDMVIGELYDSPFDIRFDLDP